MATPGQAIDPIHQFEIQPIAPLRIGGLDLSFTNSALFMLVVVAAVTLLMVYGTRSRAIVPGRLQAAAEMAYEFVASTVRDTAGKEGMKFFPFVFSLFMFVFFSNLLGLIPGSFTVTSQIIVTFAFAALVIGIVIIYGFIKNGTHFLHLFVPSGVSPILMPFIVLIEVISFVSRPISLSVRLFANMLAGHVLLKVFAGFVVGLGIWGGWAPLIFMIGFTGFEVMVAVLQAFIFTLLTCIYLNDALHMHH